MLSHKTLHALARAANALDEARREAFKDGNYWVTDQLKELRLEIDRHMLDHAHHAAQLQRDRERQLQLVPRDPAA